MVDQDKIILMSKMALYEKRDKKKDARLTDYYIEDYVYMNNFITRLGITSLTVLLMGIGAFKIVCENIIFPTSMSEFIEVYVKAYIMPWLIAIVIFTFISSVVFGARHGKASKRMGEYKRLVKKLKKYESRTASKEGATNEIE